MKIALISDTHLGITDSGEIRKMLNKLKSKEFDVLVHAGDYSGSHNGYETLTETLKHIREFIPDKPFISTIGNHDFWCKPDDETPASLSSYHENYKAIQDAFKLYNVSFIDEGIVKINDFVFMGVSGWYQNLSPPTNDKNFLPIGINGDTNSFLLKRSETLLNEQMLYIKEPHETVVFISHFPVINRGRDYKGNFQEFNWSETIYNLIKEQYDCKYFLEGHSHKRHEGPEKYNCGPDYYRPNFLIINVI